MAQPLVLKITVDDKGNPALEKMQQNVKKVNKSTKGLGKTLTRVFASAVMLQAMNKFRLAIAGTNKEVLEYNRTFKQIEGITGTSGKALDDLSKKTIEISNSSEHLATSVAQATLSISKMGFTAEESLAVIPHAANLATASMVDFNEAARVSVQTMKSYQMAADDMEHITNVIQGTVSSTAINFDEFSESLKFVAPIAQSLGISIEETAAMIGKLGDVGIKGSLAGTTLKNMFLNIMKPSDNVKKVLQDLNVEGANFNTILKALNDNNIPVSDFLDTFNKRAVAGSLALAQMTEATDELRVKLEEDGIKVADVAEIIRKAWIPSLEMLRNTFTNVFVQIGIVLDNSDLGLGIEGITKKLIDLQTWITANPDAIIAVAKDIAKLAEVSMHLATFVFTSVTKSMKTALSVAKGFIAFKIYTGLLAKFAATMKITSISAFAMKTSILALNPILAVTIGAMQALTLVTDEYVDSLEEMQRVTSDTSLAGHKHMLKAMKALRTEFQKGRKEFADQMGINTGIKMITEDVERFEARIIASVHRIFNIDPEVLKLWLGNLGSHIKGMQDLITDAEADIAKKAKEKAKQPSIEELLKMLMGGKDGDKDTPKKKGKDDAFDYWDAALEIQKQMGAAFGIGVPEPVIKKTFGAALGLQTPMSMSTVGLGAGAVEPVGLGSPVSGIGLAVGEDPLEMQVKIQELVVAEENYLTTHKKVMEQVADKNAEVAEDFEDLSTAAQEFMINSSEATKQFWLDQAEGLMSATQLGIDIVQLLQDASFEKVKERHRQEILMQEERSKKAIANAEGNAFKQRIIAAKMAKEKSKLLEQQEKEERKYKEKQKAWAMIEVGVNTAVGITQALRSMAPPASIVMAAVIAGMGLAQLAVISAQDSFFGGGFTGFGNPNDPAGTVHKEEFVVNKPNVDAIGGPGEVQEMIDERVENASGIGRAVNVFIENFIGTPEYERGLYVRLQQEGQRW